jgi:hypothetical protein
MSPWACDPCDPDHDADNVGCLGCDALVQPVITGHADYPRPEQLLTDDEFRNQLAPRCAGTENDARYGILHPDGTTTAISPDHTKTLHSHVRRPLKSRPPPKRSRPCVLSDRQGLTR